MNRARRVGVACVLGVPEVNSLEGIYGAHDAQSILSMCETHLILRTTHPETAQSLAHRIGHGQLEAMPAAGRRNARDPMLDADIMTLEGGEGYLLLPGDIPAVRVSYPGRP